MKYSYDRQEVVKVTLTPSQVYLGPGTKEMIQKTLVGKKIIDFRPPKGQDLFVTIYGTIDKADHISGFGDTAPRFIVSDVVPVEKPFPEWE